ncbi:MAG: glycoside hydrolase family 1 protein [Candidatus Omnitrophica bacterium]|nr:glycoside hydrolase family 1 protein [Candidatus Omnitrophota bacterium]MDE2222034.1 glycoside hydrolase family 1 protein [Candidatus Omnitrophota bacterium]
MIRFPENFYWGAATSSYQVEGGCANADWRAWEPKAGKQQSGAACRHYELYEQDFDLARGLNHNAHRLSIEWSRVEPREGEFSQKELQHYIDVVKALRSRGMEPMVTLHHFVNPVWFSESGTWGKPSCVKRFVRYCEAVVEALSPHVRFWFTINEPTVYFSHSFFWGLWPPQEKSFARMRAVHDNMNQAHIEAYRLIHQIYKNANLPKPSVGIAQHMQAVVACDRSFRNRLAAWLRDYWYNLEVLDYLARHKTLDFIGINYYQRHLVHVRRWDIGDLFQQVCQDNHHPLPKNSLGWGIYPEGLEQVLLSVKKYHLPVLISENGICTDDDNQRWEFIQSHLRHVHQAMEQGVNVIGYLYWSLLDNFEWTEGFTPRFGLIDVDFASQARRVRGSAEKFAGICRTGVLA